MTRSKIITAAVVTLALSAIASNAAIVIKPTAAPAPVACDLQIWPDISSDCLLTIDGKKADLNVRIVTLYN